MCDGMVGDFLHRSSRIHATFCTTLCNKIMNEISTLFVVAYQMYTLHPRIQTQLTKSLLRMMSWVWIFGYKIHLICSHKRGQNFIHCFMTMHSFTMRIVKYISSQEMSNATWRKQFEPLPLLAIWNKEEFGAKEENWYTKEWKQKSTTLSWILLS
jgi:hypothetical protein